MFKMLKHFTKINSTKNVGYTLVEMVVVIGIMGVLTAIIYSSFDASKVQSRDQKRVSDISAIQIALEQYFQKNGIYPETLNGLVSAKFMSSIPTDPITSLDYSGNYFPLTKKENSTNCISYQLWTRFEKNNGYLDTKKGFNSEADSLPNGMYECGSGHSTINASTPANALVYDVMP